MSEPTSFDPERATWVQRHGRCGLSSQLAYLAAVTWRDPLGEGIVVYVIALGVWVAAGPPVGAPEKLAALVNRFVASARASGAQVAFFGLPPNLAAAAGLRWLRCGEEPVWRAGAWAGAGRRPELERQLRRAGRLGVRVWASTPLPGPLLGGAGRLLATEPSGPCAAGGPYAAPCASTDGVAAADEDARRVAALEALQARWLAGHALAPLQFVARASLRRGVPGAIHFVASAHAAVVGYAVLLPNAPDGTHLLEQLLRDPRAPNGCSEALVDAAMRHVAARAPKARVSLGIVALAGPVAWPLRLARGLGRSLYSSAGLHAFRHKLRPDAVEPLGLAFSAPLGATRALAAVGVAFTGGRPVRFAWRSCVAGPPPLLAAMAACLVPWTFALSRVPAELFAHPHSQRVWVGFDVALTLAPARLARRPTLRWAQALAWVVTLDAVLTASEATLACLAQSAAPGRFLVYATAVAAPSLSARVLWGCVARLTRVGAQGAGELQQAQPMGAPAAEGK